MYFSLLGWFISSIILYFIGITSMRNTGHQGAEHQAYSDMEYKKWYHYNIGFNNKAFRLSIDILTGFIYFAVIFLLINEPLAVPLAEHRKKVTQEYNNIVGIPLNCDIVSKEESKCVGDTCINFVYKVSYKDIHNQDLFVKCEDVNCIDIQRALNNTMTCYKAEEILYTQPQFKTYFRPMHFIVMRWLYVSTIGLAIVICLYGYFIQVPKNKDKPVPEITRYADSDGDYGYGYTVKYVYNNV